MECKTCGGTTFNRLELFSEGPWPGYAIAETQEGTHAARIVQLRVCIDCRAVQAYAPEGVTL